MRTQTRDTDESSRAVRDGSQGDSLIRTEKKKAKSPTVCVPHSQRYNQQTNDQLGFAPHAQAAPP